MDLPEEAKRAPSAPVWNQSFLLLCLILLPCTTLQPGLLTWI